MRTSLLPDSPPFADVLTEEGTLVRLVLEFPPLLPFPATGEG